MIKVQSQPFDIAVELATLRAGKTNVGGSAIFVGSVRDMSAGKSVQTMTLEHYPGMTERALAEIEAEACKRWPLDDVLVIHRFGVLHPGDDIVLVIATSAHREAAFQACAFLMDWLKTKAPFWKLESDGQSAQWVDAKESDDAAAGRWSAT
jgi:molybdopterin synthase catalytic subunit